VNCLLFPIFKFYNGYRKELKCMSPRFHWNVMWQNGATFVFRNINAEMEAEMEAETSKYNYTCCGGDGDNSCGIFNDICDADTDVDKGGVGVGGVGVGVGHGDSVGVGVDGDDDDNKYAKYDGDDKSGITSSVDNAIIPLKLHLFWHDKILPPKMQENVQLLKRTNPEFEVVVYDNEMAYDYIKNNFSDDIFKAYNTLIPISFKSDLFRFCVVYKEGGVYLDIKFEPVDDFKLLNLVKYKEVWATEAENIVNTGIFMSVPENRILKRAIDMIKYNVQNRIMGNYPSSVTGPWLLTHAVTNIGNEDAGRADAGDNTRENIYDNPMFKLRLILKSCEILDPNKDGYNKIYLTKNGSGRVSNSECILFPIFKFYKGYREELKDLSPQLHWTKMWGMGPSFVFDV
jgi:hypothetical protein